MVKALDGDLSSDQVKDKVLSKVAANLKEVKVNAVRRTRDGGVMLETRTEEDMRKIREASVFEANGLALSKAPRPMKKVVLRRVPRSHSNIELLEELTVRNWDNDVSLAEFTREVRIASRGAATATDGHANVVLEVSDRVASFWMAMGGVDIFWRTYPIHSIAGVELCFRCNAHGHGVRSCPEKEALCKRCGKAGHLIQQCTNDESCRNCRKIKKNDAHAVNSDKCPLYRRALERLQNKPVVYQE